MNSEQDAAIPPGPIRWICVDFANTVEWRAGNRAIDRMTDYNRFLLWGERGGILSEPLADKLRQKAAARPREAEQAFTLAIELREAIYRTMFATANNLPRTTADVALLNTAYREAMNHKSLTDQREVFIWKWENEDSDLNTLTWRIAQSAATLLTSDHIARLKTCPGEGCGWLFLDTSRNGSRRWCEMQLCGNRAKVRRHRSVKRET